MRNQRFHGQIWTNIEGYDYGQSAKTLLPTISKTIYIERTNKYNGQSEMIKSYQLNCGYTEAADTVGARNIGERVARSNPSLRLVTPEDSLPYTSIINVGGD